MPITLLSVKFSPAFVSLRAAESLPGFKSWLKNLLPPHPPPPQPQCTMDSLWSRGGCCTGRREVETQCAQRSAVSQVHLEINPSPRCKGEIQQLENISCKNTQQHLFFIIFYVVFLPPHCLGMIALAVEEVP